MQSEEFDLPAQSKKARRNLKGQTRDGMTFDLLLRCNLLESADKERWLLDKRLKRTI